jgi:ketosteroid isomerase-like protein
MHQRLRLRSSAIEEATDDVLAANHAFYEAFEARDLDAMSELWEHSDRIVCTHPGWQTLRGWAAVSASWFALFGGPQELQFILTNEVAGIEGDAAWVSVDENLLGGSVGGTVAALNLFVFDGERWRMVGHHGGGIAQQT